MITYATHDKKCRQLLLLEYFGEKNGSCCNICDNCLKSDNNDVDKREFLEIETMIKELLENNACNINQIVNVIPVNREKVIEVIRFLVDEEYITYEEPLYRLN